jgi:hypothetical protein
MGTVVKMQPWLGLEFDGTDSNGADAAQPSEDWLDLKEASEVALSVHIQERYPAASVQLVIQTAVVPEGPWSDVAVFDGDTPPVSTESKVFLTANAYGEENKKFERYLRWMVKSEPLSSTVWSVCFKIDAIVR